MSSVVVDGRYISDHYPGIGRYVFNLLKALAASAPELQLHVLAGSDEPQTRFDLDELTSSGVRLVRIDSAPRSLTGRLTIRRACRRLSPTLFHAPHVFSATRVPCPNVVVINDVIPIREPDTLGSGRHRLLFRLLLRRALTSATGIITLSGAVRDDLGELCGVPAERITVAPGAADPGFRPSVAPDIEAVRSHLGLPERYVLYVGTSRPHKNLERLLEAWAGLAEDRRRDCRLVLAGPREPLHAAAERRAGALPRDAVVVTGVIGERHLSAVYSGARLLVQPSLHEGFGLPVIEAMACGTPVACSDTAALSETCSGAALLFDPKSAARIGTAIDRGLNDTMLRERLVARGLRRAGELTWQETAKRTLDAWRRAEAQHAAMRSVG